MCQRSAAHGADAPRATEAPVRIALYGIPVARVSAVCDIGQRASARARMKAPPDRGFHALAQPFAGTAPIAEHDVPVVAKVRLEDIEPAHAWNVWCSEPDWPVADSLTDGRGWCDLEVDWADWRAASVSARSTTARVIGETVVGSGGTAISRGGRRDAYGWRPADG